MQEEDEETYKARFSQFIKNGINADNLEEMYKKGHAAIRADPTAKPKEVREARARSLMLPAAFALWLSLTHSFTHSPLPSFPLSPPPSRFFLKYFSLQRKKLDKNPHKKQKKRTLSERRNRIAQKIASFERAQAK